MILIVEDDEGIGASLQRALDGTGYESIWCDTGQAAIDSLSIGFELVLLDLGLPDLDGLELCRRIRRELPDIPVIILTARGSEADIVVGLDAGADDYLVKPFHLAELFARIRAHMRRRADSRESETLVTVGDLQLDSDARRLRVDGREVTLRPKEFDLLRLLMTNAGKVITREDAMSSVWDEHWFGSTKTLDVHVSALRQRLGEPGPDGSRISTIRGVGYRLELPERTG